MTFRRGILFNALALSIYVAAAFCPVGISRLASAHEFIMESLMNAFVKIEPSEAHLVLRVPLHVLKSAKVPGEWSRNRSHRCRRRNPAGAGAARPHEITIWEAGRPLVPSGAFGRLTLPSDRSFERYTDAVAHVARPVTPGTTIYADQGYLDAHLTYAISSPNSRFMIQTSLAPELKNYLKLVDPVSTARRRRSRDDDHEPVGPGRAQPDVVSGGHRLRSARDPAHS